MDLLRDQLNIQASGVFENQAEDEMNMKVTTQIFDSTLPSELEFDDAVSPQSNSENLKEKDDIFKMNSNPGSDTDSKEEEKEKQQKEEKKMTSQYELLTQCIVNYTFKKMDNGVILRQTEHQVGSFIPYEMKVKTFPVKFYDEQSELSKGIPVYKLLWKSVVGYVKTDLYIKNGFVYLLEAKKEGLLVHSIWDLQNLFKLFSDRQQNKLRLIFRKIQDKQSKLITKELVNEDLNLLAHIFDQAKNLEIVSNS